MKVFPTNLNGHLSPTVSRPSEGRAGRDTVGTGYRWQGSGTPEVHQSPGQCEPGSHWWCLSTVGCMLSRSRTVACMPEATSCKKGWHMSERVTYGCACFIRRRCLHGKGVSGSAPAWALASCWPNFWPELHTSWPAACLPLAWGHLLRGQCGSWGLV